VWPINSVTSFAIFISCTPPALLRQFSRRFIESSNTTNLVDIARVRLPARKPYGAEHWIIALQ
jgi:hypothetical protein